MRKHYMYWRIKTWFLIAVFELLYIVYKIIGNTKVGVWFLNWYIKSTGIALLSLNSALMGYELKRES